MDQNFIFVERDVQTHSLLKSYLKHMPRIQDTEALKRRLQQRAARYLAWRRVKDGVRSVFRPVRQEPVLCREAGVQLINMEEPVECAC